MEAHHGRRAVHAPLARELRRQRAAFAALLEGGEEAVAVA
jgi:hypothetical protein